MHLDKAWSSERGWGSCRIETVPGEDQIANGAQFILTLGRKAAQQHLRQMIGEPCLHKVRRYAQTQTGPKDHVGREACAVKTGKERDRLLVKGGTLDRGQLCACQMGLYGDHGLDRMA